MVCLFFSCIIYFFNCIIISSKNNQFLFNQSMHIDGKLNIFILQHFKKKKEKKIHTKKKKKKKVKETQHKRNIIKKSRKKKVEKTKMYLSIYIKHTLFFQLCSKKIIIKNRK